MKKSINLLLIVVFIFSIIISTNGTKVYAATSPTVYIDKYTENGFNDAVTIKLTSPATEKTVVYYRTVNGSAVQYSTKVSNGKFFEPKLGSVVFEKDDLSKTVTITGYDVDSFELSTRYYYFQIYKVDGNALINKDKDLIQIKHNEQLNTISTSNITIKEESNLGYSTDNYTKYLPNSSGVTWRSDYWTRIGINSYEVKANVITYADDADNEVNFEINGKSCGYHHNDDGGNDNNTLGPGYIDSNDTMRIKSHTWNSEWCTGGDKAGLEYYRIYGKPIDITPPAMRNIIVSDGNYGKDQEIMISIVFDEIVKITPGKEYKVRLPILADDGTSDIKAEYVTGSGTDVLVFKYIVPEGKKSSILKVEDNPFWGEGYVKDLVGNTFDGSLNGTTIDNNVSFNGSLPVITSITSNKEGVSLKQGDTIDITVNFDRDVKLFGDVRINLNNNGIATRKNNTSTATRSHTFTYTVSSGITQETSELYIESISGGTIIDSIGNNASKTLPESDPLKNKKIKVDNTPPIVSISPKGGDPSTKYEIDIDIKDIISGVGNAKYILNESSQKPAEWNEPIDFEKPIDWTDNSDWCIGTSTSNGDKIIIDDLTGSYYLHLNVIDNAGNITYYRSNLFILDSTPPIVNITPSENLTPKNIHSVQIGLSDIGQGVNNDTSQYKWQRVGSNYPTWLKYNNSGSIDSSGFDCYTGYYELILSVNDNVGNNTTEKVGPFLVDLTGPKVSVNSDKEPSSKMKDYTITLESIDNNVVDDSDYEDGQISYLKYVWRDSSSKILKVDNGWNAYSQPFEYNNSEESGVKYLHVISEDKSGNETYVITKFEFDYSPITLFITSFDLSDEHMSVSANITVEDLNNPITFVKYRWRQTNENDKKGMWKDITLNGTLNTVTETRSLSDENGEWFLHVWAGTLNEKEEYITSGPYSLDNTGPNAISDSVKLGSLVMGKQGKVDINLDITDNYTEKYNIMFAITEGDNLEFDDEDWENFKDNLEYEFIDKTTEGERKINVQFKDRLGLKSNVITKTLKMDLSPPTAKIAYDIPKENGWTKGPVIATLTDINDVYSDISNIQASKGKEYKFTNNGQYKFSLIDESGNQSNFIATVDWIDNKSPIVNLSEYGDTKPTKTKSIKVDVTDNVTAIEELQIFTLWSQNQVMPDFDKDLFSEITSGQTVSIDNEDGEWYLHIWASDNIGNITTFSSGKFVFDNTCPIGTVSYNSKGRTIEPIVATLETNEPVTITKPENGSNNVEFTTNGTMTFEFNDEAGNIGYAEAIVDLIDYTEPEGQLILSTTEMTKDNIIVTVSVDETSVFEIEEVSFDGTGELKLISQNERDVSYIDRMEDKTSSEIYEANYEISTNGIFSCEILDLETGVKKVLSTEIKNIDKEAPTYNVLYSTEEITNEDIVITIETNDNYSAVVDIIYPSNVEEVSSGVYKIKENDSYIFLLSDEVGNETEVPVLVDTIDKEKPVGILEYSTTSRTASPVTVTLKIASEEPVTITKPSSGSKQYEFKDNGTFIFEFVDKAGNYNTATAVVDWFDFTLPTADIVMSTESTTNSCITVKVNVTTPSVLALSDFDFDGDKEFFKCISEEKREVKYADKVVEAIYEAIYQIGSNGKFSFVIKDLETKKTQDIVKQISNIDKEPPTFVLNKSTSSPTQDDIVVTIVPEDNLGGIVSIACPEAVEEITYGKYRIKNNGEYKFILSDAVNNETIVHVKIDNIDRVPPIPTISYSTTGRTVKPVTATITANEDINILNTSDGSNKYVFTNNGEFIFEFEDLAGNKGEALAKVDWFDFTKPTANIKLSTEEITKDNMVVTISVDESSTLSIYDFEYDDENFEQLSLNDRDVEFIDGKNTKTEKAVYEALYEIGSNGTLTFKVNDLETKVEETITHEITNIDKTKPTYTISYNETDYTNNDVIVTIVPEDNFAGEVTITAPEKAEEISYGQYKFSQNGEYQFIFTDVAGNETEALVSISNIDKTPPEVEVIYDINEITNQNITAKVESDEEINIINNESENEYVFTQNGSFLFEVEDLVGNRINVIAEVNWIDKTPPNGSFTFSNYEKTNEDIRITVDGDEEISSITVNPILETTSDNSREFIVPYNGTYIFTITDIVGNSKDYKVVVNNIDKTPPQLKFTYIADTAYGRQIFEDAEEVPLTNKRIEVKISSNEEIELIEVSNNILCLQNEDEEEYYFTENGEYYFKAKDSVGNISETTVKVSTIDMMPPTVDVKYSTLDITGEDVIAEVVSLDGEEFVVSNNLNQTRRIFSENGKYTFIVSDLAGNITKITAEVNNIMKKEPNLWIEYSTTELTNKDVIVTVKSDEPITVVNNGGKDTYTFEENGSIRFIVKNQRNIDAQIIATINNIDKKAPEFIINGPEKLIIIKGSKVNLTKDISLASFIDKDINIEVDTNNLNINIPGEYEITYKARDKAGNVAYLDRQVEVIDTDGLIVRVANENPEKVNMIKRENVYIGVYNAQGNYSITYLEGKVSLNKVKSLGKVINGNIFAYDKAGWYTILVEDQERNKKLFSIFVSQ